MLRIKRCMRLCGIYMSEARWTYVCMFCALVSFRGGGPRSKVANAMSVIIRDQQMVAPGQAASARLLLEIRKLRQEIMMMCADVPQPPIYAAPALHVGGNANNAAGDEE